MLRGQAFDTSNELDFAGVSHFEALLRGVLGPTWSWKSFCRYDLCPSRGPFNPDSMNDDNIEHRSILGS